ncbi:tetratricopeptide repeat protein [Roseovarius pelagicus]|uniref:Tetratricopeptide repeat protein n=1 Tax=Roseovarius pelagicus TaxID=2980108 RepID=A0ABY6DDF8_9RHOB|nr:tetratricopeptide repeat protein [Roseovarius pelagicus]UXX84187.1 tetratricopeptide repeat protein [Roseovarius pelagicus]
MLETLLGILSDYAIPLGAVAAGLAIVETVFAPFRKLFRKAETVELGQETREALNAPKAKDGPALTVAEFIRIRRELKAELEAELTGASQDEKQQLLARIAELESQIADPEPALAESRKRIAELEALLERSGNDIGGDRLNAARAALEKGDYSIADDLFAEIEARREMEVHEAARAAYGRGEIAEAEIRWADAATHYARAARLHPEFDSLYKAVHFSQLAGEYHQAERIAEDLVTLARQDANDAARSRALDLQATVLWRLGRNFEAEPISREALEIDRATIGEAHPAYATRLNNLAGVVQAQGRYAEAEGLYREALEVGRATIGEAHPDYATHLNNLAHVVQAQGRYAEAEGLYREALEVDRATIGEGHPAYATHLNNLALVVQAQGRTEEAKGLCREALKIVTATLDPDHPTTKTLQSNLDDLLKPQAPPPASDT